MVVVVVVGGGGGGFSGVSGVGCSNGDFVGGVGGGGAVIGAVVLSCSGGLSYNYNHLWMFFFIIVQTRPHAVYANFYKLCRHCGEIKIYTFLPQVLPHKYSLTPGWVGVIWIHAQNQQ